MLQTLTTMPLTTSPPRKQSASLTLSFSVARTSWARITPVNSSPSGSGMPSTTVIESKAWVGDRRVIEPRTTELGDGGCGRFLLIVRVYLSRVFVNYWRNSKCGLFCTYSTISSRYASYTRTYLPIPCVQPFAELWKGPRYRKRLAGQKWI